MLMIYGEGFLDKAFQMSFQIAEPDCPSMVEIKLLMTLLDNQHGHLETGSTTLQCGDLLS